MLLLLFASVALGAPPSMGPYSTASKTYPCHALDKSSQEVVVVHPTNASSGTTFPLISYAHGLAGGGFDILGYTALFQQMASHGFVVVAPKSCSDGCTKPGGMSKYTQCNGLPPVQPAHWPSYYGEQLKAIEWARNQSESPTPIDPVFHAINFSGGVGIAGHSMGGQSTANAAAEACAEAYDINAAVLHHSANGETPLGNIGSNISVPTAAFTSTGDGIWNETRGIFEAIASAGPKAYRDQIGYSHLEPVLWPPTENPYLATFTAAWFKIFLEGDTGEYHDLIYGDGPDSLCKYAAMKECVVIP